MKPYPPHMPDAVVMASANIDCQSPPGLDPDGYPRCPQADTGRLMPGRPLGLDHAVTLLHSYSMASRNWACRSPSLVRQSGQGSSLPRQPDQVLRMKAIFR